MSHSVAECISPCRVYFSLQSAFLLAKCRGVSGHSVSGIPSWPPAQIAFLATIGNLASPIANMVMGGCLLLAGVEDQDEDVDDWSLQWW